MASFNEYPDEIEEYGPLLRRCGLSEVEFWFCVGNEAMRQPQPTEDDRVLIEQLVKDGRLNRSYARR